MPLRAVLFDIGDTLWHARGAPPPEEFRRLAGERAALALPRLGLAHPEPDAVARTAWDAMAAAMRHARATDFVEPDYAEAVRVPLADLGIEATREQAAAFLDAIYVSGAEGGKELYADARPVLDELRRRGFLLAAVTNRAFGGDRFRADLRAAGLEFPWDAESVSVEVGFLKPHAALFEHALAQLRVSPGEALMVGDSLAEDIAGAQALGIRTAWRRSPAGADASITPDVVFDELEELLALPELQEAPRD